RSSGGSRESAAEASRAGGERDLRGSGVTLGGEELPRAEAEAAGEEHPREALHGRVEAHHRRVVVAARRAYLVLGVRQLVLELAEVLGGLEVRVGLRDGEEASEGSGQAGIGLGGARRGAGLLERGACSRHLVEDASLMSSVSTDRLD